MSCDCPVQAWDDPRLMGMWFQHGDNPEARVFISDWQYTRRRRDAVMRFIRRWEYRIHQREAVAP